VKCDACVLITTCQMFTLHYCNPQAIDDDSELTASDSE
jgi:hypothetical protein